MDSPANSNNCDGESTASQPEPNSVSTHSRKNSIVGHQETSQQNEIECNLKAVIVPDKEAPLHADEDIHCDKTADGIPVILDQQVLPILFQRDPEILIDESPNKISFNKIETNLPNNSPSAEKNGPEESVAEQISEEPLKMVIDEQHSEPSAEVFNEMSSDAQVPTDNLMHASVPDNCAEEAPLTVAPLDTKHDEILNPPLTVVKTEKDSDPNQSSLALLAQYDTEDDSDDDVREVSVPQTYQNRCVEIDSDSSTSDVEFLSEVRSPINLDRLEVDNEAEDDDDEEEGNIRSKRQPKVKGELHLEDLPPIEDLHITVPEEECTELGHIHSIVEQLVLVNALPGTVPLDLETVLFRDKGKQVLGEVFDVLGQVSDPLYCVRFNSNKEIKEKGIEVGQTVYVAPRTEHTQFIVLANLMKVRGSDASWENDVEPPPRFIDYSDDEEERSARRPNRKRQSSGGVTYAGRGSYTPRRPYRGNYSSRGGVRQPTQPHGNYNIVGNSWHSNFYQPQMYNQPQYRMPAHSSGRYMRPNINNSHYQQPPPVNPGLVINPYAVYPPPQLMQQPLFPPSHHQHPPPQ